MEVIKVNNKIKFKVIIHIITICYTLCCGNIITSVKLMINDVSVLRWNLPCVIVFVSIATCRSLPKLTLLLNNDEWYHDFRIKCMISLSIQSVIFTLMTISMTTISDGTTTGVVAMLTLGFFRLHILPKLFLYTSNL